MTQPILQFGAAARLEVRQQVELAAVVAAVVQAAKRHDAVRCVAAAERARHRVRRIDSTRGQTRQGWPATFAPLRGQHQERRDYSVSAKARLPFVFSVLSTPLSTSTRVSA